MQIETDLLITYGALTKKFKRGENIFEEGQHPHFFFKVLSGEVKVFSMNNDGRELIQGTFKAGESFGEPPLFLDRLYPSSARALTEAVVIKLSREKFFNLLNDFPSISKNLLHTFASRIYEKSETIQILVSHTPEEKVLGFLKKYKQKINSEEPSLIPFTRQQIADFTGLRVETVIRTLTKLNSSNKVSIVKHKVYY